MQKFSWGLELASSRGVAQVADGSSPGWLRQKSSHIHVTKQRPRRGEVDEPFGLIRRLMMQTCSLSLTSLGTVSMCTLETSPRPLPHQAQPFEAGDHSGDFFLPGSGIGSAKQKRCSLSVSWARPT